MHNIGEKIKALGNKTVRKYNIFKAGACKAHVFIFEYILN